MATHNVIYGHGKVPACIKSITSLIIAHVATNLLYGLNVQQRAI